MIDNIKDIILDYVNIDSKTILLSFLLVAVLTYLQIIWNFVYSNYSGSPIRIKLIIFVGISIMAPLMLLGLDPMGDE